MEQVERVERAAWLVRHHEGLRLTPYLDTTGHWSIGYGRNLTDVGISRDEAECLLQHDLARTVAQVEGRWPWVAALDPVRHAVVVDMAFNLGIAGLATFKRTLALWQRGRWAAAATAMLESQWARQVGTRAVRLAGMMRTGQWPTDVPEAGA